MSSDKSSASPAQKRRRTVDTVVHFTVSDGSGDVRTFDVSREACRRMPFLERKITTNVGTGVDGDGDVGDRRRVALPDGCTVEAFAALLYRVDPPNDLVSSRLRASDLDGSIALLRTADFLLLGGDEDELELVPEMLALCRRHLSTGEDAARLGAIPIAGAVELSREFTGGRLVGSMDTAEATALAVAMRKSEREICDSQARVLLDWVRVRGRSEQDIGAVLDELNTATRSCWFTGYSGIRCLKLKSGARPWVRAFAELAAERPVYVQILRNFAFPLAGHDASVYDNCLGEFVADLLLPFQGRDLTWNEISELLLALWRRPFNYDSDRMKPLTEILCGHTYTSGELREVLPKLITAQTSWVADIVVHIIMNSNVRDHMFGVNQLIVCDNWIRAVTVPFLVMLEKEAHLYLIRKIMPSLPDASLEVRKHVADALDSGVL